MPNNNCESDRKGNRAEKQQKAFQRLYLTNQTVSKTQEEAQENIRQRMEDWYELCGNSPRDTEKNKQDNT